jgi:transcriptional regulator with XRE-family HTH domain
MLSLTLATPDEIGRELGARLRLHRLAQNLQQTELAARAGVSDGTVRNLEKKGQATLESLLRIVMALGLVDELADLFIFKPVSIKALEDAGIKRRRATGTRS